MGLELVDIILRTEEAFGIQINDEDMFHINTVGKYYEYVLSLLPDEKSSAPARKPGKCLSSMTFYRLRKALCNVFSLERNQVKPDTNLEDLLPLDNRRKRWDDLKKELELKLPKLVRPGWANYIIGLSLSAVFFFVLSNLLTFWFTIPVCLSLLAGVLYITKPFATRIPASSKTAGDLTKYLIRHNHPVLVQQLCILDENSVWQVLHSIIVDSLQIEPEAVTKEARWYEDLNAG